MLLLLCDIYIIITRYNTISYYYYFFPFASITKSFAVESDRCTPRDTLIIDNELMKYLLCRRPAHRRRGPGP